MFQNKTFLAIIPARSGSKRLPNKNIKDLCGKPLIAWSIESAKRSKWIDEIVINTDSQEYAEIAKQYGINVPFLRPKEISQDENTTFEYIKYTIDFYKNNFGKEYDYVVLLQPTSPLRQTYHIDEAIELCLHKNASSIIGVSKCEHTPLWTNILPQDQSMENFISKEVLGKRSQDLPQYYRINGCVFVGKIREYLQKQDFTMPNSYAYVMEKYFSIDIDTQDDFELAEFFLKKGGF